VHKPQPHNDSSLPIADSFQWQNYVAPKFWATWLGFGFFYLLTRLPFTTVMWVGRGMGSLMYHALRSRRKVTHINLKMTFPELNTFERERLARRAFRHLGMATAETAWIWYRNVNEISDIRLVGAEHVDAALAAGKGVILLQAHFTVLELCGAVVGARWPVSAVYDPPKNPLFADYLFNQRSRHLSGLIDNRGVREMVRCLRRGEMVWYSPDQSVSVNHGGIITQYFGQPALTTSGTARILKMTGATIIPFIPTRREDGSGYTFTFGAPLNLDTSDAKLATQKVNDELEAHVRTQPEQYLWAHKRFKLPAEQYANPYT
jgi:KDO2-lipid IV(A) lauroyltransferase